MRRDRALVGPSLCRQPMVSNRLRELDASRHAPSREPATATASFKPLARIGCVATFVPFFSWYAISYVSNRLRELDASRRVASLLLGKPKGVSNRLRELDASRLELRQGEQLYLEYSFKPLARIGCVATVSLGWTITPEKLFQTACANWMRRDDLPHHAYQVRYLGFQTACANWMRRDALAPSPRRDPPLVSNRLRELDASRLTWIRGNLGRHWTVSNRLRELDASRLS